MELIFRSEVPRPSVPIFFDLRNREIGGVSCHQCLSEMIIVYPLNYDCEGSIYLTTSNPIPSIIVLIEKAIITLENRLFLGIFPYYCSSCGLLVPGAPAWSLYGLA